MYEHTPKTGRAAILIGHALLWAAAMLIGAYAFKDRPWGEDFFLWVVVGFNLSNGFVMLALSKRAPC